MRGGRVAVPVPFRVLQAGIIAGGGAYLCSRLFPRDVENLLFDMADHVVVPLMHQLEAEDAHKLSILIAKHCPILSPRDTVPNDKMLNTSLWDLSFTSPVGLAAGYDKNGEVVGPLLNMGFGFVEVGSVTPKPQPGNPRPRVFRLDKDEAIINRYGFNSDGMGVVQRNLRNFENMRCDYNPGLLGLNVGKNKNTEDSSTAADYATVIERLGPSVDYVVVNVSSPNTPGLRTLANDREAIRRILIASCEARDKAVARKVKHRKNMSLLPKNVKQVVRDDGFVAKSDRPLSIPLVVKISPDVSEEELNILLDEITSIPDCSTNSGPAIQGLLMSNTTITRPQSLKSPLVILNEAGGLSGPPMKDLSTKQIAHAYLRTEGKIPIIGVGGISTGRDAFEKIAAGASLIQIYSTLSYRGPGSVRRVKRELAEILRENGYKCVQDAVGTQAMEVQSRANSIVSKN